MESERFGMFAEDVLIRAGPFSRQCASGALKKWKIAGGLRRKKVDQYSDGGSDHA